MEIPDKIHINGAQYWNVEEIVKMLNYRGLFIKTYELIATLVLLVLSIENKRFR